MDSNRTSLHETHPVIYFQVQGWTEATREQHVILYKELPREAVFDDTTAVRIWAGLADRRTAIPPGASAEGKLLVKEPQQANEDRLKRANRRFRFLNWMAHGHRRDLTDEDVDYLTEPEYTLTSTSDSDWGVTDTE